MNKLKLLLIFSIFSLGNSVAQQFIARQGQVTFFSYASVENIEAKNNQVLSILDFDKKEIAASMLMRAFVFKKDLMHEHFNDSYIESDLYPKATFEGFLLEGLENAGPQTQLIKGKVTIHGITKDVDIKTTIQKTPESYNLTGEFNLTVNDFNIKIPPILSKNIAKIVLVKFNFQYLPHENN
ncbi:YceI family protein [Tenacibaculum agarivorans]|uniref:YceI family protein n=1 Tax=Tenacibaculum agarivorans TaxID=1908389 RepID=UPI00094B8F81|nr:YceI family protein [Tenacibaculum agarivorans]